MRECTGCKDKNGKEICVGDIVVRYDYPEPVVVEIIDGKFKMFEFEGKTRSFFSCVDEYAPEWIEVIGNIYEVKE